MSILVGKYELEPYDSYIVYMPKGAEILSVGCQLAGTIQMWALIDEAYEPEPRQFTIRGTGHSATTVINSHKFIGTVLDPYLKLVWHIWEWLR